MFSPPGTAVPIGKYRGLFRVRAAGFSIARSKADIFGVEGPPISSSQGTSGFIGPDPIGVFGLAGFKSFQGLGIRLAMPGCFDLTIRHCPKRRPRAIIAGGKAHG